MQRIIMVLSIVVMILVAILVAIPLIIDRFFPEIKEDYKKELLLTIKKTTGLSPTINGDLSVAFIPIPQLIVNNISIDNAKEASTGNLIHIESIEATVSASSLFGGEVEVKKLVILRPVLELEEFKSGENNWDALLKSFRDRETKDSKGLLENISLVNATFSYTRELKKSSIDYVNADIASDSGKGSFKIEGNFSRNDSIVEFKGGIEGAKEGAKAKLSLKSSDASIIFDGAYKDDERPRLEGSVKALSSNLSHFMALLFDKNSKLSQITSKEELKASALFSFSKENLLIKDIVVDSQSVKGVASVGLIYVPEEGIKWDIQASVDKVDVDVLFAKDETLSNTKDEGEIDYYAYSVNTVGFKDFKFDVPKSLTASLDLKLNDVIFKKKVSNIVVKTDIINGHADIENISADIPGNSRVIIRGTVKHNGTRPLFVGDVEVGGSNLRDMLLWFSDYYNFIPKNQMNEYLFSSKLRVTPQQIDMTDVSISFDKSLVSAEVSIRPVMTIPIINAVINIDRMDFDRYNFDKKFLSELADFVKLAPEASLSQSWLNKIKNKINITINAKDIVYNEQYINNYLSSLVVSKGIFNLPRLSVDSDETKFDAKLYVNLKSEEKPILNFTLESDVFDTKFFIPKDVYNRDKKFTWSKNNFNLVGLGKFYGDIGVKVGEFRHKDIIVSKIFAIGRVEDKILDFTKGTKKSYGISSIIYGGKFEASGKLGLSNASPSISTNVSLTNVEIKPLMQNIKDTVDTEGQIFLSGNFSTFGASFYDWVVNLKTKAKLSLQKVKLTGFDLKSIIKESRSTYSFIDMKDVLDKSSVSGTTTFDWIDGVLRSNRAVLQATDFKLLNELSVGSLIANISLIDFDTKGLAKISFKPERKKKVDLPISLDGNFMNLKKTIDTRGLEAYVTNKIK